MERFRIAEEKDAVQLSVARQKVWESTYRGIYNDEMINNFDYDFHQQKFISQIKNPRTKVYVIEENNKIIGYFTIEHPVNNGYKNFKMRLYSLYVLQHYQQKGIGKRVFEFISDYCKINEVSEFYNTCNHHNTKAKIFYEKMGGVMTFEEIGNENKAEDQCYFEYKVNK